MNISCKNFDGTDFHDGRIIDNTSNTVTIQLEGPNSTIRVGSTTFPTPVNRRTLEYTIPCAQRGLRTLYEEWMAKKDGYQHYRYLLTSYIFDDCDVDSHLDQAHPLSRALTVKYLSQSGHSPLLQQIVETFKYRPDLRLSLDYTLEPDSRLVSTIGFRLVESNKVRDFHQGNTINKYNFMPLLEDYFVRQLGYPAVVTHNLEETQQFIEKLFEAVPLSRDYLRIVYVPSTGYDARWYNTLDAPSALRPWYIEKQYDDRLLRARVIRHSHHELHAVTKDCPLRLKSHIYDPYHTWGRYGQKDAELLLDRFYQILQRLRTEGKRILEAYEQKRHEVEELWNKLPNLPADDEEQFDQRCQHGEIENWYNDFLHPFIFYPVHNGAEIIRYLKTEQQMRNE